MRKQKPRSALVATESEFIDLGVLNMTATIPAELDEPEPGLDIESIRMEIVEPKNWITRNKVIVRNP